ncbi:MULTISPECIES: hypothetical protein [unclassified Fusobacterium]|nr:MULTISPECIES: hypothetical protein [unclassified Fusobacterium]
MENLDIFEIASKYFSRELIWNEFNIFFEKTYIKNIQRLSNNKK